MATIEQVLEDLAKLMATKEDIARLDARIDSFEEKMDGQHKVVTDILMNQNETMQLHHKAQMDAYEEMKTWGRSPNH